MEHRPARIKLSKGCRSATTYRRAVQVANFYQLIGLRTIVEGGGRLDVSPYHAYIVWYWEDPGEKRVA